MSRLADGDRSAFRPVFDFLQPLLKRFVARQLEPADADDVAQQALLSIFENCARFDPAQDALSWAFGIAAWEIRSARRRIARRREAPGDDLAVQAAVGASPEAQTEAAQLSAAVAEVLGTLSPADFETLQRLANGERLPGATFRKRVERSLGRLRLAWSEKHGPR